MKLFIGPIYKRISSTPIGSYRAVSHSFISREVIQSELERYQLIELSIEISCNMLLNFSLDINPVDPILPYTKSFIHLKVNLMRVLNYNYECELILKNN